MSMTSLESSIWHEAQRVLNNRKMRKKDMMEWSTGNIEPREGEVVVYLPDNRVNVAVKTEIDKRQ